MNSAYASCLRFKAVPCSIQRTIVSFTCKDNAAFQGEKLLSFAKRIPSVMKEVLGSSFMGTGVFWCDRRCRNRGTDLSSILRASRMRKVLIIEDRAAIDTFRGEGFLCNSFIEESVVKKGAGDCFAVGLTDARLPHGRSPGVANSFNDVIEDNCRFFFG